MITKQQALEFIYELSKIYGVRLDLTNNNGYLSIDDTDDYKYSVQIDSVEISEVVTAFIKKNLQKVIEWKDDSKNTVVYRFPVEDRYEIMTGSTLVVRESQVAVFVHKGKVADVFEPGTYKLSTDNLPFITKLLSLPMGFESPIKAEVY